MNNLDLLNNMATLGTLITAYLSTITIAGVFILLLNLFR